MPRLNTRSIITIISLVSGLIAIFVFVTGIPNLRDLGRWGEGPDSDKKEWQSPPDTPQKGTEKSPPENGNTETNHNSEREHKEIPTGLEKNQEIKPTKEQNHEHQNIPPESPVKSLQQVYGFKEEASGSIIQVVMASTEDKIRNGILRSLSASALAGAYPQPTRVLRIKDVDVNRIHGFESSECTIKQTVTLNYELRAQEGTSQLIRSDECEGHVCLESYADGNDALQAAIRNAVNKLKSQLASLSK